MLLVVADTSPVRYLVQIGQIDLLARLFGKVILPSVVADEMRHPSAPVAVQAWIAQLPTWVEVLPADDIHDALLRTLDPGERAAIALGLSLKADLILIDERKGAAAALKQGFAVVGTIGILDLAARRRLVNLKDAVDGLRRTNFRYRPDLFDALLAKHEGEVER